MFWNAKQQQHTTIVIIITMIRVPMKYFLTSAKTGKCWSTEGEVETQEGFYYTCTCNFTVRSKKGLYLLQGLKQTIITVSAEGTVFSFRVGAASKTVIRLSICNRNIASSIKICSKIQHYKQ
jgi:hypothetical protein